MVYNGGGDSDSDSDVGGGGVDCDPWAKSTDPALDLASDSYSESKISVGDNRLSSCLAYTVY